MENRRSPTSNSHSDGVRASPRAARTSVPLAQMPQGGRPATQTCAAWGHCRRLGVECRVPHSEISSYKPHTNRGKRPLRAVAACRITHGTVQESVDWQVVHDLDGWGSWAGVHGQANSAWFACQPRLRARCSSYRQASGARFCPPCDKAPAGTLSLPSHTPLFGPACHSLGRPGQSRQIARSWGHRQPQRCRAVGRGMAVGRVWNDSKGACGVSSCG